jgi:amino acid adenylation domain-containing protein
MKKIFQPWLRERLNQFKENIAVEYGGKVFTYGDIERQSDYIADWITARGIGRETFIGIYTADRVEIIVAIIGILKAGCVFVPLDTAYPLSRLEMMVETTGIKLILENTTTIGEDNRLSRSQHLSRGGVEFVSFEELFSGPGREGNLEIDFVPYTPDDRIYIYFTSGSTGTPKAIVGKNKSLHHFINWEIETFNITPGTRISQLAIPGFDAFLKEVFAALGSGGVLCIPENNEIILNSENFIRWVDENKINMLYCVPSLFRLLDPGALTADHFRELKYILLSGEKVDPSLLENWYKIFDERIRLVNLYGLTETTILKTVYFIGKSDLKRKRVPIGKPMKGARIAIFDGEMKLCDRLITGEIYIRTPYGTLGYYRDEQSNRERFIPNPLNNDPNDIVFKTGDLGRFLEDGNIEFLGRKDRQVKIRGIRLELEEIERIILKYPAIGEAAVIKKDLAGGNELLCAYITGKDETGRDAETLPDRLRDYLREKLPDYMVPGRIRPVETIKKKSNGKVDYHALDELLEQEMEKESICYVPPRNRVQEKLVEIWRDILGGGVGKIGIRHGFFEVGGNSLNVISLISLIHRDFDVRLGLGELFEHDTIEKQAGLIKTAAPDMFVSIEPAEKRSYYAVSSVQRRLFFLQRVEPGNMSYNMPWTFVLTGEYNLEKAKKIFRQLFRRHESFRTSFRLLEGEPVQQVHDIEDIEFSPVHYNAGDPVQQESGDGIPPEVDKIVNDFIRPFDLSAAPLLRVGFVELDRRRLIFLMDAHHAVCDGTSQAIVIREVMDFYKGGELPALRLQYRDFSQWLNKGRQQKQIQEQANYWLNRFNGDLPLLNLPADYERPVVKTFEGNKFYFDIGVEPAQRLKTLAREEEATLYMVMLALFNVTLSRLTGQDDIIVGTSLVGRRHADLEPIIGMFVNALALRNYPGEEKTFKQCDITLLRTKPRKWT